MIEKITEVINKFQDWINTEVAKVLVRRSKNDKDDNGDIEEKS